MAKFRCQWGARAGTVKKGVFKGGAEAVLRALRMVGGGTRIQTAQSWMGANGYTNRQDNTETYACNFMKMSKV